MKRSKNKKKNNQPRSIPKNIKKAYAVTSCIYTALGQIEERDAEQNALTLQCDRAMKVFFTQAGHEEYWAISNSVSELWGELIVSHSTPLTPEELPVFIEWVSALIPPKDFSKFLGKLSAYTTDAVLDKEKSVMVAKSVLELDKGLNHIFGTKAYTLTKPKEQVAKVKKERDKGKKKVEVKKKKSLPKKILAERKEEQRRENVSGFLSERVKLAKEAKNNLEAKSERESA